jgi:hypothetical protein
MAAVIRLNDAAANAALDAIKTRIDAGSGAGTIKIYTGTIPTNAATAVGSQTLLGTLTFSDPSAPSATARTLTFSAITQDSSADATGTAAWARIADSDGTTIFDCSVGSTSGVVLQLNTTAINIGGPIAVTAFTLSFASP